MSTDTVETTAIAADLVPVRVAASEPEALPGLDVNRDTGEPQLVRAVVATLDEYRKAGLITAAHAGKVAIAVDLAEVMDGKRRRGRTSTYANDARLLVEVLDGFVAEEGAGSDAMRAAMEIWSAKVEAFAAGVTAGQAITAAS